MKIDEMRMRRSGAPDGRKADAEALAIQALGFLASDEDRIGAFLDATGVDPGSLRAAAGQPGFASGVLDHICSSDELLLAFAAYAEIKPERVAAARHALAGPGAEDWS
jgi:hypothetical protein